MLQNVLASRLELLPLIICGPILRRVGPESVTVWVALRKPRMVTLQVFRRDAAGGWASPPEQSETARTAPVGKNLHVVAVTTKLGQRLKWGETYGYNLTFAQAADDAADNAGVGDLFAGAAGGPSPRTGVLAETAEAARKLLTYVEGIPQAPTLPSFTLAPDEAALPAGTHPLSRLRICHGSCRKAHGESIDGLATMDDIIRMSLRPDSADPRPHALLLGGDQIYADDVADALLKMLTDAGDTLLGWEESLPGSWPHRPPPGARSALAQSVGLTAMEKDKPEYAKSHLMGLGEYMAMYLFVWSDRLWPERLPKLHEVYNGYIEGIARSEVGEQFEKDDERLELMRRTLPKVRRALANVPTHMIFDDHEVTDDWYLNGAWTAKVLDAKNPTGRRVILNGLLAYAVFQGWGNTPELFVETPAGPGRLLLQALARWRGAADADETEIFKRLNIPSYEGGRLTSPPADPKEVMRWHYSIESPHFLGLVLDTRTMRAFPPGEPEEPPDLLSEEGFKTQIDAAPPSPPDGITLVVATTNVVSEPLTELAVEIIAATSRSVYDPDKGDAWVPQSRPFEMLLSRLADRAPDTASTRREMRVVVASGDIHYGFAVRMQYWADSPFSSKTGKPVDAVFAELTASSFRNEQSKTRTLGERAFGTVKNAQLLKGMMSGSWLGWHRPMGPKWVFVPPEIDPLLGAFSLVHKAAITARRYAQLRQSPSMLKVEGLPPGTIINFRPDWRYRIDFVKDETPSPESAVTVSWRDDPPRGWFEQQIALVSEAHRDYAESGFGRIVVGRNNIGEIRFRWGGGDDKWVTQKLWWRLLDSAEPAPLTEYDVSLRLFTNKYPKPKYPGEG